MSDAPNASVYSPHSLNIRAFPHSSHEGLQVSGAPIWRLVDTHSRQRT